MKEKWEYRCEFIPYKGREATLNEWADGGWELVCMSPDGEFIARRGTAGEQNARLIAAAPELLACLKAAIEQCGCSIKERDSGHRLECWVPTAQQAVDKAEVAPDPLTRKSR